MNERPTPDTDRRIIKQSPRMCGCHYESEIVFASLARRLERERDDLLDRLTAPEHSMPIELAKIERERDEALEELQALKEARNGPER